MLLEDGRLGLIDVGLVAQMTNIHQAGGSWDPGGAGSMMGDFFKGDSKGIVVG